MPGCTATLPLVARSLVQGLVRAIIGERGQLGFADALSLTPIVLAFTHDSLEVLLIAQAVKLVIYACEDLVDRIALDCLRQVPQGIILVAHHRVPASQGIRDVRVATRIGRA